MDINKLYQRTKKMFDDDDVATNVELFLLRKPKKEDVILFSLDIDSKLQKDLVKIFLGNFKRSEKRNYKEKNYDVVTSGKFDKEFYSTCADDYNGVKVFIQSFEEEEILTNIKGLDESSFFAYAVRVSLDDDSFIFLAPFAKVSELSATKVMANLKNNKLTKLPNDRTVGFSYSVSMIIHKNEVLMTNNLSLFEKCCGMNKEYKEAAKSLLNKINNYNSIDGIAEIDSVVDSDGTIAKRLTKMNQHYPRVEAFFKDVKNVKKVLDDDAFKDKFKEIQVTKDGKIKFDKKNRHVFITLISNACYETIMGKYKGIDGGF